MICEKDLGSLKGGTVVIRSHGVGRKVYNTIKKYGLGYVDVTCPFVLKIHKIVERESSRGAHIVIIGDPGPSGSPGDLRMVSGTIYSDQKC